MPANSPAQRWAPGLAPRRRTPSTRAPANQAHPMSQLRRHEAAPAAHGLGVLRSLRRAHRLGLPNRLHHCGVHAPRSGVRGGLGGDGPEDRCGAPTTRRSGDARRADRGVHRLGRRVPGFAPSPRKAGRLPRKVRAIYGGSCRTELQTVPGAKCVVCEACGTRVDVGHDDVSCTQCAFTFAFPMDVARAKCPACDTIVSRI